MPTIDAPQELYRTSVIMAGMENLPPPSQFLRSKLFSKTFTTTADQIDVRTYLGGNRVAPFCSRFSKGHNIPRERERMNLFSPPFIKFFGH